LSGCFAFNGACFVGGVFSIRFRTSSRRELEFGFDVMDDLKPFESPKLLIDDAKVSIVNFKAVCETFIQNCTYDVVDHLDPNSGEKIVKLRFHNRIPPKMRVPVSGIVNDLRHSLDQAVVGSGGGLYLAPWSEHRCRTGHRNGPLVPVLEQAWAVHRAG
jgi:hypothetical protein